VRQERRPKARLGRLHTSQQLFTYSFSLCIILTVAAATSQTRQFIDVPVVKSSSDINGNASSKASPWQADTAPPLHLSTPKDIDADLGYTNRPKLWGIHIASVQVLEEMFDQGSAVAVSDGGLCKDCFPSDYARR